MESRSATTPKLRRDQVVRQFLKTEAGGGVLLFLATVAALAWANSPWWESYDAFWHMQLRVGPNGWGIREDLQHWVNDVLMVFFFLLIGLEIKRETAVGELNDVRKAVVPLIAALGGMIVPALLFLAIVGGGDGSNGWGIPMATDIAFAVGVLALLGKRVPGGLKLFLLTLAIVDDIGAIAVIAFFYSGGISWGWLGAAAGSLGAFFASRRMGARSLLWYLPLGAAAWYSTYRAGVHPTIAGVALGLLVPAMPIMGRNMLEELEGRLHPWSSFLIIPMFALANAGVHLDAGTVSAVFSSKLVLAIVVGLVAGKTFGISVFALLTREIGLGRFPRGVDGGHVFGLGALGGIGFTVALFIASLAFSEESLQDEAKIGILAGSIISGVIGALVLIALKDPVQADIELPDD